MIKKYNPKLNIRDTQFAIDEIKNQFQKLIRKEINLTRVSAPLFLDKNSKLNDNLSGVEKSVEFKPKNLNKEIEIVHSLAKWKRVALKKYNFNLHEGIFADMNAIRADEIIDYSHSIYVDQWDWEYIIDRHEYNIEFLQKIVLKFYKVLYKIEKIINDIYLNLNHKLPKDLYFISSKKLYEMFPNMTAKERENEIVKIHKAVFITQIGCKIEGTNEIHDVRAKDYDNWGLNGDLIVYHEPTNSALELMSMGIRVDQESLLKQGNLSLDNINNYCQYYQDILNNNLPLTIGGGFGQSRLCMFLLEKIHIGEVQVSVWTDKELEENNFIL